MLLSQAMLERLRQLPGYDVPLTEAVRSEPMRIAMYIKRIRRSDQARDCVHHPKIRGFTI